MIGEGEAFHRSSPDGNHGEKAVSTRLRTRDHHAYSILQESWRLLRITQYVGDRQLQCRSRLARSRRVGIDAQQPTFDAIERRRHDGSEAHHSTMET